MHMRIKSPFEAMAHEVRPQIGTLFDSPVSNNDILTKAHLKTFEPIDKYIVYSVKNSIITF